ncbi:hypothetical protein G6F57_005692 [Rhizopus arrhizus]|uniref:MPN domain-containing protein n=1 Tax=Rhizopus oryzae TaxID=64495 RepID=A0A9P6XBS8_RHIOR|nr:hypothetical protein G6F23_002023 [Rhizopus arrhizus]KAG0764331.1 hypothetical protein G6F24_005309 [Rhizopus arrhizus]KAG0787403.1 hypothetical protein G6F22_007329 [Rhizopus arrhizus]KAG0790991.1 hypothetical protein G6F21_005411 [Rhizopus arrhizus]KAG0810623.1 hypothetical protein G6F20_007809 [Rhizopus arrhizus]
MTNIQINTAAYAVPLLHAAKYPSSSICGALLGKVTNSELQITKAVPFFHHWTTLTPMLEVALQQTEIYAQKNDLKIVGWYHANEVINDHSLPERAVQVVEIIRKQFEKCLVLLIDNKAFTKLDEKAFIPYSHTNNHWKKGNSQLTLTQPQETFSKTRDLITSSTYQKLHDFDEALENTDLDWLNSDEFI